MSALPMDIFGIVYIIDNAQQFWSELEDMLRLPEDATLDKLDSTLRRYISFCGSYHEQFLQSPLQLRHACDMIIASDLFSFHSERMCEILVHDAQTNTDPHYEMVLYSVILAYGRRNTSFLRNQKRWQPLLPLLMDHVRLDVDPEIDDGFYGSTSGSNIGSSRSIAIPIEAKLRSLSVKILYEVCRLQKMSLQDLRMFDDSFIDYLFDLVEQTRGFQDETFNYSVIKLIVALNEQFMLATMQAHTPQPHSNSFAQQQADSRDRNADNRILRVLKSRVGSSPTFGENMIFMLNRADRTAEDLCMQLLVLKLLYLLFTSKDLAEYFYTNDLCVLVDVFLREIGNIDEDHESLRHTFLRVLHPLLTKTQLRSMPYKRPQIVQTLESLIQNESIRHVDPTTKRLVERCMSGEWCVKLRKFATTTGPRKLTVNGGEDRRGESPGLVAVSSVPSPHSATMSIKSSALQDHHRPHRHSGEHSRKDSVSRMRHASGDSTNSLPRVATAADPHSGAAVPSQHRHRAGSFNVEAATSSFSALSISKGMATASIIDPCSPIVDEPSSDPSPDIRVLSPTSPAHGIPSPRHATLPAFSSSASSSTSSLSTESKPASPSRRAAPPPPLKVRRKPPAVPIRKAQLSPNGGPLSALAASSQPNLAAFSSGRASAN
ncbi:hypothetical protein C8Q80DRAFT_1269710 [Daedaleopsis nitida]|nr:hypothetical protein C8Q80DRAFT_1269710 [Daedaleopsis nitida]